MTTAFMLDTSFLISLVDDSRRHHPVARQYFECALQQGVPLHVSTLALAEFAIRQAVTDLPLRCLLIVPFNVAHAVLSGSLSAKLLPNRDADDQRSVVRADVQLLAQASVEGIPYILTEDRRTLSKYADRARAQGACQCETILLADGFDRVWFNDRQRDLELPEPPKGDGS